MSWHLTRVNKLITNGGFNLLFSFCYTLGPKAIQTSEANFSLNNSKKVRLGLRGRRWAIEASRSPAVAACPAGSSQPTWQWLASGSSFDETAFSAAVGASVRDGWCSNTESPEAGNSLASRLQLFLFAPRAMVSRRGFQQ